MRKLADELRRIEARNWTMLAIALLNLCWLYSRSFEGLWKILFVVPAFGALAQGFARREFELDRFTLLLCASCGFLFLSAFVNRKLGVNALIKLLCYITFMLYPAVAPRGKRPGAMRREATSLSALIVAALLPLMALGVASVFLGRPIRLPGMQNAIGIQIEGLLNDRIIVLDHTNVTGKFAVVAILLCVYLLHQRPKLPLRALLWAAIAVFALALTHTQSRTAIYALCAGAGAIAFHFLWLRLRGRRWRAPAAAAAGIVAAALALALLLGLFSLDIRIAQQIHAAPAAAGDPSAALAEEAFPGESDGLPGSADSEDDPLIQELFLPDDFPDHPGIEFSRMITDGIADLPGTGRIQMWGATLRYLAAHPVKLLFGMGPSDIISEISNGTGYQFDTNAHLHNAFVELLARGGIFCLLSMLAALALLVRPAARLLVAPEVDGDRGAYVRSVFLLAMLVISLAELPIFAVASFENLLFFLFAGHIAGLKREQKLG